MLGGPGVQHGVEGGGEVGAQGALVGGTAGPQRDRTPGQVAGLEVVEQGALADAYRSVERNRVAPLEEDPNLREQGVRRPTTRDTAVRLRGAHPARTAL